jgi:hypothetical protein
MYSVLHHFIFLFLAFSVLIRTSLLIWSVSKTSFTFLSLIKIYGFGILYDFGVALFIVLPYSIYLNLLPQKWSNTSFNIGITYGAFFLATMISMFSFLPN